MRSDLPKFASKNRITGTPEENKAIVHGSIAYFGTYSIDEATHVFTVNIEGNTVPNFTGRAQTRILSFDGDEVTYSIPRRRWAAAPRSRTVARNKGAIRVAPVRTASSDRKASRLPGAAAEQILVRHQSENRQGD